MSEPEKYARGGIIQGRDPDDDTVPALLSPGCSAMVPPSMSAEDKRRLVELMVSCFPEGDEAGDE